MKKLIPLFVAFASFCLAQLPQSTSLLEEFTSENCLHVSPPILV